MAARSLTGSWICQTEHVAPLMWHHYGDAHKGMCLMFDREKLDKTLKKQVDDTRLISGEVNYSDEGIVLRPGDDAFHIDLTNVYNEKQYLHKLSRHLDQWLPALFFRKLKDWSNEEEYRWVYFDDKPEAIYLNFEDSLEAIIVGEKVPKQFEEIILKYCVQHKADITDLEWRNGYPTISHPGQPYITHRHLLK